MVGDNNILDALNGIKDEVKSGFTRIVDAIRDSKDRVIIMIDRSNLDQTWRQIDCSGLRPDYMKLTSMLVGQRSQKQVRVYFSELDADRVTDAERVDWQRRQDFYNFLRHQGWVLRCVSKKIQNGVPTEKGLDGALIRDMDMIGRENRADVVVLVAGDADYVEVVGDLQDRYCVQVEVAFFPHQTAKTLRLRASKFVNLECVKNQFVRRPSAAA